MPDRLVNALRPGNRAGARVVLYVAAVILWATIGSGGVARVQAAAQRHLSISDMLRVEGLGAAAIDPKGRWLIYERLRPYDRSDDYSFRSHANGKTGHQLWRYDLKNGGTPTLLPGLDPAPHSYIQGFSTSGRFLAVIQYRLGRLSLATYDMADRRFVRFDATPAFSRDGQYNPIWTSDGEMIFAALPAGQQSEATSVRAYSGQILTKAWTDAWGGKTVTANEVRSRLGDESGQQESGSLVRADARTGRTRVLASGLYADLRLSPDKRNLTALAVSRPRPADPTKLAGDDPRRFHLMLFDLKTGRKKVLAPGLEFFPYTTVWSADGRKLAAYGWRPDQGPRDGRFFVIDVSTGSVTRYDHRGLDLVSERERGWLQRPERIAFLGDRLAVFARPIPAGEDQAPRFTYRAAHERGLARPDWYILSVDGRSANLSAGLPNVSGVPVHAGIDGLTITADDGVYRLLVDGTRHRLTPPLSGHFRFLSPGTFATSDRVIRPDYPDTALFDVTGTGLARIAMVDLRPGREGSVRTVDTPTRDAMPLVGSLARGVVLFQAEDGPATRLLLARTGGVAPQELARINDHLVGVELGRWERVTYKVRNETGASQAIESCILRPPGGGSASQPPPLVVEVYPGLGPNCVNGAPKIDSLSINWSPYLWASRGYAYARLSLPENTIRRTEGPIAGMPAAVDAGVDALVAKGFADPKRLALVGFSQGGISALYVAAHTTRFRAIFAMNSWADLFGHYFGPNGIYSYVYGQGFGDFARYDLNDVSEFGIGRTPFDDPQFYYRNSPVFLAPKITAPVMLVHSDMDSFSMSQFDEMFGALTRAGKDVRYVRYWGEGHGPSSPANIRDLWQRIDRFFTEVGITQRPVSAQAKGYPQTSPES